MFNYLLSRLVLPLLQPPKSVSISDIVSQMLAANSLALSPQA
jgi:hypothetical protein